MANHTKLSDKLSASFTEDGTLLLVNDSHQVSSIRAEDLPALFHFIALQRGQIQKVHACADCPHSGDTVLAMMAKLLGAATQQSACNHPRRITLSPTSGRQLPTLVEDRRVLPQMCPLREGAYTLVAEINQG